MATVTGVTVVKRFPYRGDTHEEYSNTYHFKAAPPSGDQAWLALLSQIVPLELAVMPTNQFMQRAYGYDSNDPGAHHVFVVDWEADNVVLQGEFTQGTRPMSGDQAACVEWKVARLSSKGKPIYLRKYWHGGPIDVFDADMLDPSYLSALQTYADTTAGIGSIHGGLRSAADDDSVTSWKVIPYVTTRTLKRRGRRPRTGN